MNREEARQYVKSQISEYLSSITRKKGNMWVCPLCGSGNGKNGTAAGALKDNKFSCFSCSSTSLDTFDLIAQVEGISVEESFKRAYEIFNVELESDFNYKKRGSDLPKQVAQEEEKTQDYMEFFLEANKRLDKCDYLTKRGISKEVQDKFKVGYAPDWKSPTALGRGSNPPASPRIIIPTSRHSYLARDIRPNSELNDSERKYAKMKEGKAEIFNLKALRSDSKVVFVVEGEIDALSIIEAGEEAVGLGSISKVRAFIEAVKLQKPKSILLISLDNEEKGKEAQEKLVKGLKELKADYIEVDAANGCKDTNDALVKNRADFIRNIRELVRNAKTKEELEKEEATKEYESNSAANYVQSFINGITDSVNTPAINTGFKGLDGVLEGGLYEGLYCIGAISSLGKTTMLLQIADNIAKKNEDILIFSLEMARTELMSKSISRITFELSKNQHLAKTNRGITSGKRYSSYSSEEIELIKESIEAYREYASNIYIHEGIGDIGVIQVREIVEKHIKLTGRKPVVVVDYLQLLAPAEPRATDKQNTDKSVMELKRISRDFKTPVLAISSLNRSSYSSEISMSAFKESGAVEYSSDVLIGLQLKGVGSDGFDVDKAKNRDPREVELKVLKNRNGQSGTKIDFEYYPKFNYFTEI